MIQAMIFDLDGTLVQTERLKALSYARAAIELCPWQVGESEVLEVFKEVVGLSRRSVAITLVERFELQEKARERMPEFAVDTPWQAFVQGCERESCQLPVADGSDRDAHDGARSDGCQ